MYLNDYYDSAYDQKHRPSRPIPSGEVSRFRAFLIALVLLALGLWLCWILSGATFLWGALLVVFIFAYNLHHKRNPWSPFLMAGCRLWLYPLAASAAAPTVAVWLAGLVMYFYIVVLTYMARRGFRSVGFLIAGICIVDLLVLGVLGNVQLGLLLILPVFFVVTQLLQRRIPGT